MLYNDSRLKQKMNWLEVSLLVNGELAEAVADVLARFAPNGVVSSYSFNSDQPEDSHIKPKPAEPIF